MKVEDAQVLSDSEHRVVSSFLKEAGKKSAQDLDDNEKKMLIDSLDQQRS